MMVDNIDTSKFIESTEDRVASKISKTSNNDRYVNIGSWFAACVMLRERIFHHQEPRLQQLPAWP
jgi:hypothetical protein